MEVEYAKKILSDFKTAEKVLKEDQERIRKNALEEQLDKVRGAVEEEEFDVALRFVNTVDIDESEREKWRKMIRREQAEVVKRTIPDQLYPLEFICPDCNQKLGPTEESFMDNKHICLISYCSECDKRIVCAFSSHLPRFSPVEQFIGHLIKEVN